MHHKPIVFLVAATAMVGGRHAGATVLAPMTVAQMTNASSLVVRGRILSTSSRWVGHKIVTRVRLQPDEVWKSPAGSDKNAVLSFYRLGGKVGRIEMRVEGAARFRRGEHVVLFLAKRASRLYVTGMVQGAFRLRQVQGRWQALRSVGTVGWTGKTPSSRFSLDRLKRLVLQTGKDGHHVP
ncbi:MAG: hypothetical protein J7M25_17750 [Deltaproteobacteria bacterium]|nr:hypothetical protein [Deltaproteobacteria bacterium]